LVGGLTCPMVRLNSFGLARLVWSRTLFFQLVPVGFGCFLDFAAVFGLN